MRKNILLNTFITFIILFSSCGKEEWQPLFNGKSLEGWTASENPAPPRDASHAKRVLSEGTFALQCHDPESRVYFKNILVKRLPDNL